MHVLHGFSRMAIFTVITKYVFVVVVVVIVVVVKVTPVLADVRLVGSNNAGRLEFYRFNEWTSVCPTNFKLPAADWVCRKLGYKYSKQFLSASILG